MPFSCGRIGGQDFAHTPTTVVYVNEFPDPKAASTTGGKKKKHQTQEEKQKLGARNTRSSLQPALQTVSAGATSAQSTGQLVNQDDTNKGNKAPKRR